MVCDQLQQSKIQIILAYRASSQARVTTAASETSDTWPKCRRDILLVYCGWGAVVK